MQLPDETDIGRGLSAAEAALRLQEDGPNDLPGQRPRALATITKEVLTEPMFLLLIAAATIYLVLGDVREALVLASSILIIVVVTVVQERRTENALAALRDLSSPRALVVRDGIEQRIPGREVVMGDIVLLHEGDRVPADGVLRSATALSVDESILTGESLPADKSVDQGGDAARVYSGSLVVRGFGTAQINATGARSEIGRIGHALTAVIVETTPLFREVRRIVRWVAVAALLLCATIAVIYALSRADWLGGILAGITLAMGVLPEEFPVVLTVFLAMGAWRISRAGVLTRRLPAIESIGAATLLAVDKTGTLTENRMRVALIESGGKSLDLRPTDASLDERAKLVLMTALAASERAAFDPMEQAIHVAARLWVPDEAEQLNRNELVREYDLTPELPAVTHVWRRDGERGFDVAVKGAPETVFALCRLDDDQRSELLKRVALHADRGLRVLGVARGRHVAGPMPDTPRHFELEFLGLLCLADPLRQDVPDALAQCARAGIRVVMITGDHPGTAVSIATQAGFDVSAGVLTGADLARMTDEELRGRTAWVNIYARTRPEHKLRLVQAFKDNGEVVAMTGDGVNDAPALRAAHVGVAMGGRGTDVAREAASIVLVNDDFNSLVGAVRLGRRIYANIRHAMSFIVAVHIPIAGLGLLPVLLDWPLLFFPLHVLFLEFIIDPACAFVFEADSEARDIMERPPRRSNEPLFSAPMLRRSLALGLVILAATASIYGVMLREVSEDEARALAFSAIIVSNLTLIFVSRSRSASLSELLAKPNRVYWWIAATAFATLCAVIYFPSVAELFRFAPPSWAATLSVLSAAVALVLFSGLLLRAR